MNNAVLVRGSQRLWDVVLILLLGLILTGLGLWITIGKREPGGLFLALPSMALIVVTVLVWVWRVLRRQWAWDTGTALVLSDRGGERDIADHDVQALGLSYVNSYAGGVLASYTRNLILELTANEHDRPEKLTLTSTFLPNQQDPLAGLINRVSKRLVDEAAEDLAQGRPVGGQEWAWRNGELTIFEAKEEKICPIDEISVVELLEGYVSIWCEGEDEAYARVPEGSLNSILLEQLLRRELEKRPSKDRPPPRGKLGRILFERNSKKYFTFTLVLALFAAAGALFSLLVLPFLTNEMGMVFTIGMVSLIAAGVLGLMAATFRVGTFRCHEFGVYQCGLTKERSLRYSDVEVFTYSAIRQFYNGVYTGTSLSMNFQPAKGDAVTYSTTVQNVDEALDNLRDQIARIVAGKMSRYLGAGEIIEWTSRISFHPNGLLCRPAGWFGKKAEELVPYNQITGYDMKEGVFYVWINNEKKPFVETRVSEPNFFPGFYLFLTMMQGGQTGAVNSAAT